MTMQLRIDVHEEEGWTIVVIDGELDAHTASQLDFELAQLNLQGHNRMVLDMARVELVDSTGLGALVAARNRCHEAGGQFALANPRPVVLKVIRVTGLQAVLPVR